MSRTAQTAHITIVDNVTRAMALLGEACEKLSGRSVRSLENMVSNFDNKKNLSASILEIRNHLTRRSQIA